jgi:hypothetical protein
MEHSSDIIPAVQAISITQIDGSHTCSPAAVITLVVGLDRLDPEVASPLWTVLAEADVDQKIACIEE